MNCRAQNRGPVEQSRSVEHGFDPYPAHPSVCRAIQPEAARALAEGLLDAGDSLVHFPHRGRVVPGTDKRELVTAYPYILRYRIVGNEVRILRVRHTSRRPTTS